MIGIKNYQFLLVNDVLSYYIKQPIPAIIQNDFVVYMHTHMRKISAGCGGIV